MVTIAPARVPGTLKPPYFPMKFGLPEEVLGDMTTHLPGWTAL
jgi:hypothetical protein